MIKTVRANLGAAILAGVVVAGCGALPAMPGVHRATAAKGSVADIARAPVQVAAPTTPCVETKLPPPASRLTDPRAYPTIRTRLSVVPASVRPRVAADTAFDDLGRNRPEAGACGVTEVLAFWSSDDPATVPPSCVPPGTSPWSPPPDCPATPIYPHVLAWVFTWREDCVSHGGPAPVAGATPRPVPSWPPHACTAITFVDANTGAASDYLTIASL